MRNKIRENQVVYKANGNTITLPIIERIVEKVVNQKLQKLLSDPDYGLKLHVEFKQKLNTILKQKRETIPEEKIAEKYGVKF